MENSVFVVCAGVHADVCEDVCVCMFVYARMYTFIRIGLPIYV